MAYHRFVVGYPYYNYISPIAMCVRRCITIGEKSKSGINWRYGLCG